MTTQERSEYDKLEYIHTTLQEIINEITEYDAESIKTMIEFSLKYVEDIREKHLSHTIKENKL